MPIKSTASFRPLEAVGAKAEASGRPTAFRRGATVTQPMRAEAVC